MMPRLLSSHTSFNPQLRSLKEPVLCQFFSAEGQVLRHTNTFRINSRTAVNGVRQSAAEIVPVLAAQTRPRLTRDIEAVPSSYE
jgi:hypothetical protein